MSGYSNRAIWLKAILASEISNSNSKDASWTGVFSASSATRGRQRRRNTGRGRQSCKGRGGEGREGEGRLPGLPEVGGPPFCREGDAPAHSRRPRVKRLSLRLDPGRGRSSVPSLCSAPLPGAGSAAAGGVSAAALTVLWPLLRCPEGVLRETCACVFKGFLVWRFFYFCYFEFFKKQR